MTVTAPAGLLRQVARPILLFLVLASLSVPAWARHSAQHETVDGLEVYIGLLPAPMVQRFPKGSEEERMHGGPPGKRQYHLVAAVFDSVTGHRIEGADVRARVAPLGLVGAEKHLEPMKIQSAASYGQYFGIRENGRYTVIVTVRRTNQAPAVVARFTVSIYRRMR